MDRKSKTWRRSGSTIGREKRKPKRRIKRMTETELRMVRQKEKRDEWQINLGKETIEAG